MKLTVSVLCGGKSSRMQQEKGLMLWQDKTFVAHIIQAASTSDFQIQLISNSDLYQQFCYPVFADLIPEKGPLGGIYTALHHSNTEINLILSCDIPLISSALISKIVESFQSDCSALVCRESFKIHPLIGIYTKKTLPIIAKNIQENQLKMQDFLQEIKAKHLELSSEEAYFVQNINTQEEYSKLTGL